MSIASKDINNVEEPTSSDSCAIETSFPYVEVSRVGRRESYRKEIFRPIYHIHKWWANRLGSVFRAIVLGALLDNESDIWKEFYEFHDFRGKVVLDPFMGSGTTLGEAAKLGAKPVGCDINPVSTFAVKQALQNTDVEELKSAFHRIERDVCSEIRKYYHTIDPVSDETIPVLYYFWVKMGETSNGEEIPLFTNYVFSKNAYPKRKPISKILCPYCWSIHSARYDSVELKCDSCKQAFNPQKGPARGQYVLDSQGNTHKIKTLLPTNGSPPKHKLYAILALRQDGKKVYLKPQSYDHELFSSAKHRLAKETLPIPDMVVRPGYNTNQARGYNYTRWEHFFNERQLLCLGLLLERIMAEEDTVIREQLLCLFSGTLEFNNLFCSFKGEGTGAVRHMFAHHILKPEKTPLENSVWGTHKSSGTFLSLFKSRLLKAKEYLTNPTEISLEADFLGEVNSVKSTYVKASKPICLQAADGWSDFSEDSHKALILNSEGGCLPIPDQVIDAVVTDPPYFDFVHYSELSDFFYAWLSPALRDTYSYFKQESSYNQYEVQDKDPQRFSNNLGRVFCECRRVLKNSGTMTFSFHHSRAEGWAAIYDALYNSKFSVVATYPVYAEMKVASPKSSAKEPISLDMLLVCKKQLSEVSDMDSSPDRQAIQYIEKLRHANIDLSKADIFNIHAALLLIPALDTHIKIIDYQKAVDLIHTEIMGMSSNK